MPWNRIAPPARDELRALIVSGMTHVQLMQHYGCSKGVISAWKRSYSLLGLRPFGAQRKHLDLDELRGLLETSSSIGEVAQRLGCSIDLVVRHMQENKLRTPRQIAREGNQITRRQGPTQAAINAANPFGLIAHEAHF